MTDEFVGKIFEMISAAGTARSKYVEAIGKAKAEKFEESEALLKEGSSCFLTAHDTHAQMLAEESSKLESEGIESTVSLILVHAEDQMMCAESFRLIAEEFIDVYKKMSERNR